MTKKEYIDSHDFVAYYSGFGGTQFCQLDILNQPIDDTYIYFITGAWNGQKKYHKAKVRFEDEIYIVFNGTKIRLTKDCVKM